MFDILIWSLHAACSLESAAGDWMVQNECSSRGENISDDIVAEKHTMHISNQCVALVAGRRSRNPESLLRVVSCGADETAMYLWYNAAYGEDNISPSHTIRLSAPSSIEIHVCLCINRSYLMTRACSKSEKEDSKAWSRHYSLPRAHKNAYRKTIGIIEKQRAAYNKSIRSYIISG